MSILDDGDFLKPHQDSRLTVAIADLQQKISDLSAVIEHRENYIATLQRERAQAENTRIRRLFADGPDTPCRTTWRYGVEYVEVPMSDLRQALGEDS